MCRCANGKVLTGWIRYLQKFVLFVYCCGCESCGGVTGNSGGAHRSASSAILSLHSFPPKWDSGMNNYVLYYTTLPIHTALSHYKVKNYISTRTNSSVELRQKLPSRVINIKIESGENKRSAYLTSLQKHSEIHTCSRNFACRETRSFIYLRLNPHSTRHSA